MKIMMRKKLIWIVSILFLSGVVFYSSGSYSKEAIPVDAITLKLVSMSAAIDGSETFIHLHKKDKSLNIVARIFFYHTENPETPYLTIDAQKHAVLHINLETHRHLFNTYCEFNRQFEVEIPNNIVSQIATLEILNHDTGKTEQQILTLNNKEALANILKFSSENVALEAPIATKSGC